MHMLIKQKSFTSHKPGCWDFQRIASSVVLNKGNSAKLPQFNSPQVFSSACDKAKLLKPFLETLIGITQVCLPAFFSRTNLTLCNTSVSSKFIEKVITNLDLSKTFDLDCIPVVILKNCEPAIFYILANSSIYQSFPYKNHCKCYEKLASRSWPVLFTLTYFFLDITSPFLQQNKKLL